MLTRVQNLALQASQRSDVVVACFTMLAVVMIIIPLPTPLVDALIAFNIAISVLILVVTFYIRHPVEFSALPPIILLATLFRLALSITTTRLILLQADAGEIVSAFGHFVIAGQVVIGLVVFFIIAIAQFVVITKGAERVAEVAARFVLDAMPGKHMSIDNDLRNGDIEPEEGKRRRNLLERESQLYGAMDGAMKFVKGDAIAVLVILFINLVGGLTVGMIEHGMPFSEAIRTYSLLTVGDGLIAQIPALLISVGAGTVVTRVSSDHNGDLGGEIVSQLGRSDRALALTAAILAAIAFIPGFSTVIFLLLAAGLGLAAWLVRSRNRDTENTGADVEASIEPIDQPTVSDRAPEHAVGDNDRVVVVLGPGLADTAGLTSLSDRLAASGTALNGRLGIAPPGIGWRIDRSVQHDQARIELDGAPVLHRRIESDCVLALASIARLESLDGVVIRDISEAAPSDDRVGVAMDCADRLVAAGIDYRTADDRIIDMLDRMLSHYAAEFLGIQETHHLLAVMQSTHPDLVTQVTETLTVPQIAATLRRLVEEGVSVDPLRNVLEALAEQGGNANAPTLNAAVRRAVSRSICHQHADEDNILHGWAVAPELEKRLADIGERIREGKLQSIPTQLSRQLKTRFDQAFEQGPSETTHLVVCSANMRRPLFDWSRRHDVDLSVVAWSEITAEYRFQSRGLISVDGEDSSNASQYDDTRDAARA